MVTTTTSQVQVTLESLDDWPVLTGSGLGAPNAVLEFAVRSERPEAGVRIAAERFAGSIERVLDGRALALLVRLGTLDLSSRLASYRVSKDGPWALLAPPDLARVAGSRTEQTSDRGRGVTEFFGELRFALKDLGTVMGLTWNADAAVVCGEAGKWSEGRALPRDVASDMRVFEAAASLLPARYDFVARGFGGFGEPMSGVDVVGDESLLARVARVAAA